MEKSKLEKQFRFINDLSNINRFSQSTLCRNESVLEHSACVAMLANFVADKIEEGTERKRLVDRNKLLHKALFHDADETITGDIARPVKYHSNQIRNLISIMEADHMKDISDEISYGNMMFKIWEESKKGPEGAIVRLCDSLAVVYKLEDEVLIRGNKSLGHLATNKLLDHINECIKELYFEYEIDELKIDNPLIEIVSDCAKIISQIRLQADAR